MIAIKGLIPSDTGWDLHYTSNLIDINNNGEIFGIGLHHGSETYFLMTPHASPVPEPHLFVLLGFGIIMVGLKRKFYG